LKAWEKLTAWRFFPKRMLEVVTSFATTEFLWVRRFAKAVKPERKKKR
jgi:hypothetical protein